jgi:hypothetical protein
LASHVSFLPRLCPEEIVLQALESARSETDAKGAKATLAKIVLEASGSQRSEDIDNFAWASLAKDRKNNIDLQSISKILKSFLPGNSA